MKKDTILIFQRPELYFFPYLKDIVFPPFGIPEKSLRYLIYKALHTVHSPLCHIFWGDWKKHIKGARQVIIFDYGYQAGMETYIKKINPSCQVYLFCWNTIDKNHNNYKLFTDKNAIFSTDINCCQKYHFQYNHMFYIREYYHPYSAKYQNRLFFLGADKGRAKYLAALKKELEKNGLDCDIRVVISSGRCPRDPSLAGIVTRTSLSYSEYCKKIQHSGILLDVNQKGQRALTMRVMETIYFSKKLITNNKDIVHYPFYNENNIYLLPKKASKISAESIQRFLERPFLPYPEEILSDFDFEHWKQQFSASNHPYGKSRCNT